MSRTKHQVTIGQRFGRLVVRYKAFNGWVVFCDCGKIKVVTAAELCRGKAKSCGCRKREKRTLPGVVATNYIFDKYQRQAKMRGLEWELSRPQFDDLIKQSCHYCGLQPSNKTHRKKDVVVYSGIDRKDNHAGYTTENSAPCCKTCNLLKKTTPYQQFVEYLNRVAAFRSVQRMGASV